MASVGRPPDGKDKQIPNAITGPSEASGDPMNTITVGHNTPHSGAEHTPAITNAVTDAKKV